MGFGRLGGFELSTVGVFDQIEIFVRWGGPLETVGVSECLPEALEYWAVPAVTVEVFGGPLERLVYSGVRDAVTGGPLEYLLKSSGG